MKRSITSLIAILLILLGGFGAWQLIAALEPEPNSAPPRDVGPPRVAYLTMEPRDLTLEIKAYGNLEASRVAQLSAEVGGRIVEVYGDWKPGARIREGELLVRLDPGLFELDVSRAEAALAEREAALGIVEVEASRAQIDLRKLQEALEVAERQHARLVQLGVVASELQRDELLASKLDAERALEVAQGALATSAANRASAKAGLMRAEADLERSREVLRRSVIRAPFDGRLRGHAPGIGTLASAGMPLAELVDPSSMVLVVRVPERDLLLVRAGMPVQLVFPNTPETDPGAALKGLVSAVDVASDPLTRRGLVEITLEGRGSEGAPLELPVGLFARAILEIEQMKGVLWIDRSHFRWEGAEAVAYVIEDGPEGPEGRVAKRRVLKLWREHGEGFVVKEGLKPGDRLVTMPLDRMLDGVAVQLTESLGASR